MFVEPATSIRPRPSGAQCCRVICALIIFGSPLLPLTTDYRQLATHKLQSAISSQYEPFLERILRIKIELISSNDRRRSSNLGNNGLVRTKLRRLHSPHSHRAPQNTLDRDLLVQQHLSLGVMQRRTCAHARTRRRPVNLAFGKDAHVAAMVTGFERGPGEDRPVEKTQVLFKRMPDREFGHHGLLDPATVIDKLLVMIRSK